MDFSLFFLPGHDVIVLPMKWANGHYSLNHQIKNLSPELDAGEVCAGGDRGNCISGTICDTRDLCSEYCLSPRSPPFYFSFCLALNLSQFTPPCMYHFHSLGSTLSHSLSSTLSHSLSSTISVAPSHILSVEFSHTLSVAPSLTLSVAPSLTLSVAPSQ